MVRGGDLLELFRSSRGLRVYARYIAPSRRVRALLHARQGMSQKRVPGKRLLLTTYRRRRYLNDY